MNDSRGAAQNVGVLRTKASWVGDKKLRVGTTEADSDPISGYWSSLAVKVVTGAPSTLTVYAAPSDAGPFTQFYSSGAPAGGTVSVVRVSSIPAGAWVEIPTSVFPCGALKFVGDTAGEIEVMVRK